MSVMFHLVVDLAEKCAMLAGIPSLIVRAFNDKLKHVGH